MKSKRVTYEYACYHVHRIQTIIQNIVINPAKKYKNNESVIKCSSMIKKLKRIIKHFTMSPSKMLLLLASSLSTTNSTSKRLIMDVPTRWNSTFYMIERYLEMDGLVTSFIINNYDEFQRLHISDLQNNEKVELHNLMILLKPFEKCTKILSAGEHVATSSSIIPSIERLKYILDTTNKDINITTNLMMDIRRLLLDELNDRFKIKKYTIVEKMAMMLDPRFVKDNIIKENGFNNRLTNMYKEEKQIVNSRQNNQLIFQSTTTKPSSHSSSFFGSFGVTKTGSKLQQFKRETLDVQENVLKWWKQNEKRYPILARLAKK